MSIHSDEDILNGKLNAYRLEQDLNFHSHGSESLFEALLGSLDIIVARDGPMLAFAGREHVKLGRAAYAIENVEQLLGKKPFYFGINPPLDYGQIVALAGDFYARFDLKDDTYTGTRAEENNFIMTPLTEATDIDTSLKIIRSSSVDDNERAVEIERHLIPLVREKLDHSSIAGFKAWANGEMEPAEARKWLKSRTQTQLRFGVLALENWDHFHPHCIRRYKRLQERAKQQARAARLQFETHDLLRIGASGRHDLKARLQKVLLPAVAINAFAMHFLTDAFAAGHFFGRRKEDYQHAISSKIEAIKGKALSKVDGSKILFTKDGVSIRVGEVIAGKNAQEMHDLLGRGTLATCRAFKAPNSVRPLEFVAVGDWKLSENPFPVHYSDVLRLEPHLRGILLAMVSSLHEVLAEFFSPVQPFAWHGVPTKLQEATAYIPHPIDKSCGCVNDDLGPERDP